MEDGRKWSLRTFGADGVKIREQVPNIIARCHEKMANAQAEAEMDHAGPYGYIWKKALDEFVSELGRLPGAEIVSLYRSPYKLVAFREVVLFPWRYSREVSSDPTEARFAVSDARISIFNSTPKPRHSRLEIPFDHDELTEDERQILRDEEKVLETVLKTRPRVVVVAYSSNPSALNEIYWGEAKLSNDGYLAFSNGEILKPSQKTDVVGVHGGSFDDGDIPRPFLEVKTPEVEEQQA